MLIAVSPISIMEQQSYVVDASASHYLQLRHNWIAFSGDYPLGRKAKSEHEQKAEKWDRARLSA